MPFMNDLDPLWFERNILPLWYHFTLLLALTCPLLYLTHRIPHRTFLALLTAFANLSSHNESYNLARPVCVCFYPIKGETFHHPEEGRLTVQYQLFLGAWGLAVVVFLGVVGQFVVEEWRGGEGGDRVGVLRMQEKEWREEKEKSGEGVESGLGEGERVVGEESRWRKVGNLVRNERCKDVLMGMAWFLTVGAWLVMYGHSKKGKFGGGVYD